MSSIVNKVKEALSLDKSSQPEGTHGTHDSRVANAADPRIDSDRDHREAHSTATHGTHGASHTAGATHGVGQTAGGTQGPHSSNLANRADPLVDSDRGHSHTLDSNTHGTGNTGYNTTGASSGTTGPHSSNLANKLDPKVDSDRDHRNAGLNTSGAATTSTTGYGTSAYGGSGAASGTHGDHTHALGGNPPGTSGTGTGSGGAFFSGNNDGTSVHGTAGTHTGHTGTHAGGHTGSSGIPEGTYGTHNSRIANAADPRIDSDLDSSRHTHGTGNAGVHSGTHSNQGLAGTHGHTGTHGTQGLTGTHGTPGTHGSSGIPEGTYGTHDSRIANAADPRIDSDLDSSRHAHSTHGTGNTGAHSGAHSNQGLTGTHGHTGTHGSSGIPEGTYGTHDSRIANAADPRIDSDLDSSRHAHGTHGTGNTGVHSGAHSNQGLTGTHGHTGTHGSSGIPEGTYGTHDSRIANAADPRIDSDLDSSRHAHGTHGTGNTGVHSGTHSNQGLTGTHGHTGTHDAHGAHGTHGTTGGSVGGVGGAQGTHAATGPAPNTAGPHKSDMLNKVDPRVDSNLDGSKTIGGDKTFSQSQGRTVAKDPTDAAQVPPSVLQKHIGQPTIQHDDHKHDRERRHSVSHQEQHRGL